MNREWKLIGDFLPAGKIKECRDPHLRKRDTGESGVEYIAFVDVDSGFAIGCICHKDDDTIVIDAMDSCASQSDMELADWVEDWVSGASSKFGRIQFVVNGLDRIKPYWRHENRNDVEKCRSRFDNQEDYRLYDAVVRRKIQWYEGCGISGVCDLEAVLASLVAMESSAGFTRVECNHRFRRGGLGMVRCLRMACRRMTEYDAVASAIVHVPPMADFR